MNIAVLDCSILVKWFFEEPGTAAALRIRQHIVEQSLEGWCPTLAIAEFANIVWHKTEQGTTDHASARAHVSDFLQLPLRRAMIEPFITPALRLAHEWHITVYDACYAALAYHLRAPLLTADKRLAKRLHTSAVIVDVIT